MLIECWQHEEAEQQHYDEAAEQLLHEQAEQQGYDEAAQQQHEEAVLRQQQREEEAEDDLRDQQQFEAVTKKIRGEVAEELRLEGEAQQQQQEHGQSVQQQLGVTQQKPRRGAALEQGNEHEVQKIIGQRRNASGDQFAVIWADHGPSGFTWESETNVVNTKGHVDEFTSPTTEAPRKQAAATVLWGRRQKWTCELMSISQQWVSQSKHQSAVEQSQLKFKECPNYQLVAQCCAAKMSGINSSRHMLTLCSAICETTLVWTLNLRVLY